VCSHGNQHICFNSTYSHQGQWLKVQSFHSTGDLINCTRVSNSNKPASIYFDVCATIAKNTAMLGHCGALAWERVYMLKDKYMCLQATSCVSGCASYEEFYRPYWGCLVWVTWQRKGATALLQKGEATSNCTLGSCSPVNFTIFNLSEPNWGIGQATGILIDGKGEDPSTLLHFRLTTITHESSSYQVFHSFYEEMKSEFPISVKTKNLFLSPSESIAQTLNVTLCYVCGGTNKGDCGEQIKVYKNWTQARWDVVIALTCRLR
jgi:hypothetical protein